VTLPMTSAVSSLVEEHDAEGVGIEEPARPRQPARPWAAVEDHGWLAVWIAARLPVDEVAVADVQHAALVRLDLRVQVA